MNEPEKRAVLANIRRATRLAKDERCQEVSGSPYVTAPEVYQSFWPMLGVTMMIAFGYLVLPTGQAWPKCHVHQRGKEDITRRWHSWLDHVLEQVAPLPSDLACLRELVQVLTL